MVELARDEAVRAKTKAEFTKTEAKIAKDKAEDEGYKVGVAETQAHLKAQIPGVCRLYCSQVWNEALKRAGVEALSDLWKAESIYYPPAIRETASTNSKAVSTPEEAEAARPEAAQPIVIPDELTEGGETHKATKTPGGLDPKTPQEVATSSVSGQISGVEEPTLFVQPLQVIPFTDVSKGTEDNSAQPSQEGDASQGSEVNPAQPTQEVAKTQLKK